MGGKMNPSVIALAPLLCLALSAVILLVPAALQRPGVAWIVSLSGFVLSGVLLWPAWQQAPVSVTELLMIDRYALAVTGIVVVSGLVVTVLGHEYFRARQILHHSEIYLLLLIAALGGGVLAAAEHFASLFLGVELMGIATAVLIAFPLGRVELEAGVKYLVLSGMASAFLVFGMGLVYAGGGVLVFSGMDFAGPGWVGLFMILAGLAFKLSWVPFHLWIGDVYQGAPPPVAAFLGSASKSAALAVFMRLLWKSDAYQNEMLAVLFIVIACFSILVGNWLALLQNRIKRLLAYSAIAHFGYLLVLPATAGRLGMEFVAEASAFYLIAYSLAVGVGFGSISVMEQAGEEVDALEDLRGLFHQQPLLASLFTVALLSLAGLPLTIGFIGKFYLFSAAVGGELWWLALVMVFGSGLGMVYYLRVILVLGQPRTTCLHPNPATSGLLVLGFLVTMLVWLGIFPSWIMGLVSHF